MSDITARYRWEPGSITGQVIDPVLNQIIEDHITLVRARAIWPDITDGREKAQIVGSIKHHSAEMADALHENRMAKATIHADALWADEISLGRLLIPDPRPPCAVDEYDVSELDAALARGREPRGAWGERFEYEGDKFDPCMEDCEEDFV
jgi:hypothetical protein